MLPVSRSGRMTALDGLRGIAANAVMFHHEAPFYGSEGAFPRAYLAVDFFFMLSGFVLTRAYEPRFANGMTSAQFMAERVRRLWPLIAVGLCIGAALHIAKGGGIMTLPALALMLAFVPVINSGAGIYFLNGPMWSLSFELVANYVHAKLLRRFGKLALMGFIALFAAALAAIAWQFDHVGVGDITRNWWGGFIRVGFSYAVGVWLGRQFFARSDRPGIAWQVPMAGLVAILTLSQYLPISRGLGDWLLVVLVMPPLLWLGAQARVPERLAPLMDRLGQISYPLYAIHAPLLGVGLLLAQIAGPGATPLIRFAAIMFTLALAWWLANTPLARGLPKGSLFGFARRPAEAA